MPIPDSTYFGPDNITFGDVRHTNNVTEKIGLLKCRLDSFFISQIDVLDKRSPFPLAIMCCIALETLGAIFIEKKEDIQSYQFCKMLAKVDNGLSVKLSKKFLKCFEERWPDSDTSRITTRAELLYSFLRNTLMHGYYARGVYLNDDESFKWDEGDGFLSLNPYWLWRKIKIEYESVFKECIKNDNTYRKNAVNYINRMLK